MSSICLVFVVVAIFADTKQCTTNSICECTQDEACILQCIGNIACQGSGTQLICKSGYPCTIICDSNGNQDACKDTVINDNGATSITLECADNTACKTATINCGNAIHCDTTCTGDLACEQTNLYCDKSQCSIDCHAGSSNTCKDISVNTNNAASFNCYNNCPPGIPDDFTNVTPNPMKSTTSNPSITPTKSPIKTPTTSPSKRPSLSPIPTPTSIPTPVPIKYHTPTPTKNPLPSPTSAPTQLPTSTSLSTSRPTVALTTSVPTRTSITANPSSANPTINPSMSPNSVLRTNAPNESHTINPTKLPSVSPSVSLTTVSDGITSTEKSESNEKDTSDVGLGMPLWMIVVIGFGIVCCLLLVLMLCIRKRKKKSYVSFESPDVNENDKQIGVRTDRAGTYSINSIFATVFNDSWNLSSLPDIDNISNITCEQIASKQRAKMHDNMAIKLATIAENNIDEIQVEGPPKIFSHMDEDVVREINQNINQTAGIVENDDMDVVETVNVTQMLMEYMDEGQTNKNGTQFIIVNV